MIRNYSLTFAGVTLRIYLFSGIAMQQTTFPSHVRRHLRHRRGRCSAWRPILLTTRQPPEPGDHDHDASSSQGGAVNAELEAAGRRATRCLSG